MLPVIALSVCILSGCTDYTSIIAEKDAEIVSLKTQVENLTTQKNDIQTQYGETKKELDDFKYGPQNLLVQIKKYYEAKDFFQVVNIGNDLHNRFTDSPEDKEARQYVQKAKAEVDKKESAAKAEQEKVLADAKKSAKEKYRSIIRVSKVYPSEPNSADGVDLHIVWTNKSDKEIKYAYFTVVPYNAVGDIVTCDITGESTFIGKETGPFRKGEGRDDSWRFECAWYNNTIDYVELTEISIDYIDGTSETLSGDQIEYILY